MAEAVQQVVDICVHRLHLLDVAMVAFIILSPLLVSPIRSRVVIETNATVDKHRDITPDMLAAHIITDTEHGNILCNWRRGESLGQDYKEKHKLDSKQISNSPC